MVKVFGIKQCSTMKKAFDWLDAHGIAYQFHDYKQSGIDAETLSGWASRLGWEGVLNTRGTTWRGLPDAERAGINRERALMLMQAKPSLIKRPIIMDGTQLLVGFDPARYGAVLEK